jgi:hypothetical protein
VRPSLRFGLAPAIAGLLTLAAFAEETPASPAAPRFAADTSKAPDLQPWGRAAEAVCQVWYPKVVAILKSDDASPPPPPDVKIVFETMDGVAYTAGGEIHISADWVRKHPNDFGMVVHELTHVVQRYPRNRAGWLVEGIADYVRLRHFEPQLPPPRIDFAKAKYTDSYKTTATFLAYLEDTYGADVVPKLNAALRRRTYKDELFEEIAGKPLDALWADFVEAKHAAAQG